MGSVLTCNFSLLVACRALFIAVWVLGVYGCARPSQTPRLSAADRKVVAALQSAARFDFFESPLADVVKLVQDKHGIAVQVHYLALRDAGIKSNPLVTCRVKGTSLHSCLRLTLGRLNLAHVIRDGALVITTEAEARQLVEAGQALDPASFPAPADAESAQKIAAALRARTVLDFIETPLEQVAEFLKDQHDVEVQVDDRELAQAGLRHDLPVTLTIKGVPLEAALQGLCAHVGATYVVRDGMILITGRRPERR